MFYGHWKKMALALTGFFWVSCDSDTTSANGENISAGNSSDSGVAGLSSSSGSTEKDVSSSSMNQAVALYGVPNDIADCYLDKADSSIVCTDGLECKQVSEERWESEFKCIDEICPDYGVVRVSENTYECDGQVYNEAEFLSKHRISQVYDSSIERVSCDEAGENVVTCNDGITYTVTTDEKGNKTYTDGEGKKLSETEFNERYVIREEMYAPLYGISW